jgi:hypothetical protein
LKDNCIFYQNFRHKPTFRRRNLEGKDVNPVRGGDFKIGWISEEMEEKSLTYFERLISRKGFPRPPFSGKADIRRVYIFSPASGTSFWVKPKSRKPNTNDFNQSERVSPTYGHLVGSSLKTI